MTSADLAAILHVEQQSFGTDAWDSEHFNEYLADPERSHFLVAYAGEEIAGYGLACARRGRAEIDSIAVAPAHRRKQIAMRLLRRLVRALRVRGFEAIYLSVRKDNDAAIRLYESLGFERFRAINDYYEDGAPALRMRLTLPSQSIR